MLDKFKTQLSKVVFAITSATLACALHAANPVQTNEMNGYSFYLVNYDEKSSPETPLNVCYTRTGDGDNKTCVNFTHYGQSQRVLLVNYNYKPDDTFKDGYRDVYDIINCLDYSDKTGHCRHDITFFVEGPGVPAHSKKYEFYAGRKDSRINYFHIIAKNEGSSSANYHHTYVDCNQFYKTFNDPDGVSCRNERPGTGPSDADIASKIYEWNFSREIHFNVSSHSSQSEMPGYDIGGNSQPVIHINYLNASTHDVSFNNQFNKNSSRADCFNWLSMNGKHLAPGERHTSEVRYTCGLNSAGSLPIEISSTSPAFTIQADLYYQGANDHHIEFRPNNTNGTQVVGKYRKLGGTVTIFFTDTGVILAQDMADFGDKTIFIIHNQNNNPIQIQSKDNTVAIPAQSEASLLLSRHQFMLEGEVRYLEIDSALTHTKSRIAYEKAFHKHDTDMLQRFPGTYVNLFSGQDDSRDKLDNLQSELDKAANRMEMFKAFETVLSLPLMLVSPTESLMLDMVLYTGAFMGMDYGVETGLTRPVIQAIKNMNTIPTQYQDWQYLLYSDNAQIKLNLNNNSNVGLLVQTGEGLTAIPVVDVYVNQVNADAESRIWSLNP